MSEVKKHLTQSEKINLAGSKAKGQRPYFLQDKQTEQALSVAMTLAMELSVVKERLSSLECMLVDKGVIEKGELDQYQPSKEEVAKRSLETQAYLARVLRIMQQDKEELERDDPDMQTVQDELTKW
ncbi:hypothetical protein FX988_04160 [Paraglaciecola mesophila]|uniref:Uncharacterized protein n=1 Tax=Paraglaciecola mesophila TaxID=197222 RepID=A0A857JP82_9ALTE|nr:hypothetical protein [Paraglaciecola mesophila]QHJ13879.1 hypothetical protein FX988_04160 [Paraglaciecola mesophila]